MPTDRKGSGQVPLYIYNKTQHEVPDLYLADKWEFIGVIQALAFLMECQGFAVKREQTAGEARKVQANSFKFINQIVRKILSL